MKIEDYFKEIDNWIGKAPFVETIHLIKEKRGDYAGLIEGALTFRGNYKLHLMELVNLRAISQKLKYRYHFVDKSNTLLFRYDNAPHYKTVSTFPHHKHLSDGSVIESKEPTIQQVIEEVIYEFVAGK